MGVRSNSRSNGREEEKEYGVGEWVDCRHALIRD